MNNKEWRTERNSKIKKLREEILAERKDHNLYLLCLQFCIPKFRDMARRESLLDTMSALLLFLCVPYSQTWQNSSSIARAHSCGRKLTNLKFNFFSHKIILLWPTRNTVLIRNTNVFLLDEKIWEGEHGF